MHWPLGAINGGARNSNDRIFYAELWVSKDLGETWELRCELPEDMGRATSVVIGIPGALTSNKVFLPIENWRSPSRTSS